jgi:xylulokinase
MSELLLGLDIGTSNIKAALATPDGRVVAQAQAPYPMQRSRPGWAEQNPEDWWQGVSATTRQVVKLANAQPGQIVGIGVSGQGCGATLINARGEVIRPAIIWMDTRSEPQCARLRATCGDEVLRRNGKQPAPYNGDTKLMWLLEHEPDTLAAARCSLTTTGYINFRLTGEPIENISDASILFAFDQATENWSDELIAAFGLPRRLYPTVAPCRQVIGGLTPSAAEALGLESGLPVIAGGEDTSSAGLAIGIVQPGQALLSLGTAGTLFVVLSQPLVHPQLFAFQHVLAKQILLGGSMTAAGAALNWCRRLFADQLDYGALTELAAQSDPGAGGVIFLPYLTGEMQPINDGNARGVFFGLSFNTEQPQLVRAVMEGAAFAVAHNLRIAREAGAALTEIRAVGGPTRSPLWCQIIADATDQPLAVMAEAVGAPLGNALLAAAGIGLIDDPAAVAVKAAQISKYFEPQATNRERYQTLFEIYRQLYPQLKNQFAALAALEN